MVGVKQTSRHEIAAAHAQDPFGRQHSILLSGQTVQHYGTPRRKTKVAYHVDQNALCEMPKPLHAVRQNQSVARQRMSQLQKIFTSCNSEESDAIREQLASLDEEAEGLRSKLALLERELQEVHGELPPNSISAGAAGHVPSDVRGTSEDGEEDGCGSVWDDDFAKPSEHGEATDEVPFPTGETLETQDNKTKTPDRKSSSPGSPLNNPPLEPPDLRREMSQMYTQEIISPILWRRRAEARFREASLVHERCISQRTAEMMEVERRRHKQELWIKDIEEQILQAEMAKAQYKIRAKSAECRIRDLSKGIQSAYVHTKALLEERLSMEDNSIRNDALVSYLDDLWNADAANGASFQDSRREIRALVERFLWKTKCAADLDRATEAVQHKQRLLHDMLRLAEALQVVIDNLKTAWLRLPAATKETISHKAQTLAAMPPAAALQAMATSCQALIAGQKLYSAVLGEDVVMSGDTLNLKI